jgi:hypothetical protein
MRRVFYPVVRSVAALWLLVVLAGNVVAASRDNRGPREKSNPIVKAVKKLVRALGDGLIIPTP